MADRDLDPDLVQRYARLISLAVHELRTPASVVGGYLRMLQRDTDHPMSERQRKMVDEASRSCGRLVDLIAELGEVGKLDDGRIALQHEPFDLFTILDGLGSDVTEAADREVTLSVRGPASGARMVGDKARVRTAFESLCRAVMREQADSVVTVLERQATFSSGPKAIVVIARQDDVERTRTAGPSALDEKRSGLGLILPIARRVIERHGGRVWSPVAEAGEAAVRSGIVVSLPIAD